jgi:hypothetical protein
MGPRALFHSAIAAALLLANDRPLAQGCAPLGKIQFLCGVISPEDFALVPGSEWMLVSGNHAGQGAIRALHPREQKIVTLFPSAAARTRPDTRTYAACPGPLDATEPVEKARFAAHGLYLKPGSTSVHILYVVHHGARESLEVFEVDGAARPRRGPWRHGALLVPDRDLARRQDRSDRTHSPGTAS